MPRKKLTDLFVAKVAAPTQGRVEYFDATFPALALRVTDSGHKSWSLFYRAHGRLRRYTIGPYPAFHPAAARKAASTALHKVQAGGDPAEEKRARRLAPKPEVNDFASVAREYLERQVKRNTAKSTYRETARIIDQDVIPNGVSARSVRLQSETLSPSSTRKSPLGPRSKRTVSWRASGRCSGGRSRRTG